MTVINVEKGYAEAEYLGDPYLTSLIEGNVGFQATFVIDSLANVGMQSNLSIANKLNYSGFQTNFFISDSSHENGMQSDFTIKDQNDLGQQANFSIENSLKLVGMQTEFNIVDFLVNSGIEVRSDRYPHIICGPGYLDFAYMEDQYLASRLCHVPGMQTEFKVGNNLAPIGMQTTFTIKDVLNSIGMQSLFTVLDQFPIGMQFDSVNQGATGQQFLSTIYNTTNLRILCDFPSRGLTDTNWTATSTMPGDFSVQNIDTDIVEQVWRSNQGDITGVRVQSDTGIPQGVFLDTLAILNHNISRSATVSLLQSDDPTFTIIGSTTPLEVKEENIYYISPILPVAGYRYIRIDIDDPTNTDSYIEIGSILFGASNIFQGECFVDELDFQLTDFNDTVKTEGFTNVSNSRALKRKVRLEFRFLNFQKNNFKIMRSLFETYRTTHKCLWIPTPSATDSDITSRFASFSKLTVIPSERHRYLGGDADYVSFTLEVDESL